MFDVDKLDSLLENPTNNLKKLLKMYARMTISYYRMKLLDDKNKDIQKLKQYMEMVEDELEDDAKLNRYLRIRKIIRKKLKKLKNTIPPIDTLYKMIDFAEKTSLDDRVISTTNNKIIIYLPQNQLVSSSSISSQQLYQTVINQLSILLNNQTRNDLNIPMHINISNITLNDLATIVASDIYGFYDLRNLLLNPLNTLLSLLQSNNPTKVYKDPFMPLIILLNDAKSQTLYTPNTNIVVNSKLSPRDQYNYMIFQLSKLLNTGLKNTLNIPSYITFDNITLNDLNKILANDITNYYTNLILNPIRQLILVMLNIDPYTDFNNPTVPIKILLERALDYPYII